MALVSGNSNTGGMAAKRYGRIGDSPVIGAGTWADNNSCVVSATGHDEYFIRYSVASDICARVQYQGMYRGSLLKVKPRRWRFLNNGLMKISLFYCC